MNGYHGQVLLIDLANQTSHSAQIDDEIYRKVVGGGGLATLLLAALNQADCDPLSPESALVFAFSPLVGSPVTTSAKFAVACRSPLTGFLNDSLASSRFAISGKQTGHDALIVYGAATVPQVLLIDEDTVEFQPAEELWGLHCSAADTALKTNFGNDYSFAVIGPAGERQVRFATISHDGRHAGRGGSGAVMGSKQLKAIGVRGRRKVSWAQPSELVATSRTLATKSWGPATAKYRELGTLANLLVFNRLESLPTRNFQESSLEGAENLSPESLGKSRAQVRSSCAACTVGCEHIYALGDTDQTSVRLEYESVFALGPLCGINDPQTVLAASQRCDELGMDTISMGGTLAFAMECVQRDWLQASGIEFGNSAGLLSAIEATGNRRDIGVLLAEGSKRLARLLGPQTLALAPQVKGLELPGYDPRRLRAMAVGLAVCARGADHNRSGAYEADFAATPTEPRTPTHIANLACGTENRAAVMDSLILCKFIRGCLDEFWSDCHQLLQMVTGWETESIDLQACAQRIIDLKKYFNQLAGWTVADDSLPDRFFSDTDVDPPGPLSRPDFQAHVKAYYAQRSWTEDGLLGEQRVQELQALIDLTTSCLNTRPA